MALVDRIDRALVERKLDPETFERAACALLQSRYPWLSPVEAGRDLGRDADIYRPLPEDPESRGRLLATTGDAFANLKRSHKRWVEEGLRVDQLVIACSNNLTGTTRKKIDQYCVDNSLPLPEYYGRDWLVNALLSNTEWREALTGVRGRLESLRPASFGHAESQTPFVGRDAILGHLQSTIGEGRDVVLEGVPGVGKTRLLGELGNEVSFVEPHARTYLAEDLLAFSPKCVVVDDAHPHAGLLAELSSLRTQEGLAFVIVASTWPDHASETATVLPSSARIRLDMLPRTEIDVVVQAAGVTSVRARQLVLDQAEGRPGWALALCSALVEGNGDHVASGATLLDQVERYLRGASDSATTMDAMALIAALGGATQDDLERISQLVGVPAAVLLNAVHAIATNGLLEEAHGRWHLQSALCAPIVSRWFFGMRKSRSWNSTLTAFPERAIDLTSMLLRAAAIQPLGEAGMVAREWARALPPATHWDEPTIGLVRDYSRLDEEAATFATHAAQEVLSSPRAVNSTPWGSVYDPMGIAARGVLTGCVYQWFNKDAVQALLTLAVGDDRARPQTTDHPMRILGDVAHHLDPDRGSLFEVRELLLTYAMEWLAADPGAPGHWAIFCEAVRCAFAPAAEGNWTDPCRTTLNHHRQRCRDQPTPPRTDPPMGQGGRTP